MERNYLGKMSMLELCSMERGCGVQDLMRGEILGYVRDRKSQPRLRSEAGECYSKMTQERNTGARPYKVSPDKRGFVLFLRGPLGRFDNLKSAS